MAAIRILTFIALGILLLAIRSSAYSASSALVYTCQSKKMREFRCRVFDGDRQGIINVHSVTVLTNSDSEEIQSITASDASGGCQLAEECRRTIHNSTDTGISDGYKHLYDWILNKCQGKPACDVMGENDTMPKWWDLTTSDVPSKCVKTGTDKDKLQYFASALVDISCLVGEEVVTVQPPPSTTPRTRPTTPTTTTPFPVFVHIYQPHLAEIERVILGVAIGLAIVILLVLLIVIYCCERYRHSKKFGKLLRMLGAPQAQDDAFDELDYGRKEAWHDETQNPDALGEYTGVKPDEFMTLDKDRMVMTGQILYDTPQGTMQKGNSCSTIDRLDRKRGPAAKLLVGEDYHGPTDYETEENLELERRMAATLNYEIEPEIHESGLM